MLSNIDCSVYSCTVNNPLPNVTPWPSMDLREANLVTAIKYQDQCGCCYAFSTTAVLENSILLD